MNRIYEVLRSSGVGEIVYPDGGVELASNGDYTRFFLPAYRANQRWTIQHRATGVAAQQGFATEARGPSGETQYNFDIGDGSNFGFMPGTSTTLRVLQASFRFYQTVRGGLSVDRYSLRCRGVDKPCYQTVKAFDGRRDCRQCVRAESVWPTEGLGWAYGGAPLNATTPGENVGAFYPSTNKLLLNLLDQIAPGAQWMVAGLDVDVLPLIPRVVAEGGHVRVGLEDAPFGSTRSNVEWAEAAVRVIDNAGGEVATPEDVRNLLAAVEMGDG